MSRADGPPGAPDEPKLVSWTDSKGREYEVPRKVKAALEARWRGQRFAKDAAKVIAFFTDEAVLEQWRTAGDANATTGVVRFVPRDDAVLDHG